MRQSWTCLFFVVSICLVASVGATASPPEPKAAAKSSDSQTADREAALVQMLRGATLEGSYTSTRLGADSQRLSRDKYTLGDVRKVGGNLWLIEARIEYDKHDVTLPITVPIYWAADTPIIAIDNLGVPPFGNVSARVMFFDDHYAGYWKHGDQGGHLFGVIKPGKKAEERPASVDKAPRSLDAPAHE